MIIIMLQNGGREHCAENPNQINRVREDEFYFII